MEKVGVGACTDSGGNLFDGYELDEVTLDSCITTCKQTNKCIGLEYRVLLNKETECYCLSSSNVQLSPPNGVVAWDQVIKWDQENSSPAVAPIASSDSDTSYVCYKLVAGMLVGSKNV